MTYSQNTHAQFTPFTFFKAPPSGGTCTVGSTTYTVTGNHTFVVPANCTSIIVEAWGGGGGGGGDGGGGRTDGSTGAQSDVDTTIVAGGGAGGGQGNGGAGGAGGTASGGDTNTNGSAGAAGTNNMGGAGGDAGNVAGGGGTGAPQNPGHNLDGTAGNTYGGGGSGGERGDNNAAGGGGGGAYVYKVLAVTPGANIDVNVGAGGAGGSGNSDGGAGANGRVVINYGDDDTPDSFNFTDQTDVLENTLITSDIVQINGISVAADVDITGDGSPQYRICDSSDCSTEVQSWTSGTFQIDNGEYLQLRLTSNASWNTLNSATVTVGSGNDTWNVTTMQDTVPNAIDWVNFNDTSSTQTINGIAVAINLRMSFANGTGTPLPFYRKNGGSWIPFTPLAPVSDSFSSGDTLQFQIQSGSTSDSGTITITNLSHNNDVIDTTVGTTTVSTPCTPGTQTYAASGNYTDFYVPVGCAYIRVKAWGAGGGGGGDGGSDTTGATGGNTTVDGTIIANGGGGGVQGNGGAGGSGGTVSGHDIFINGTSGNTGTDNMGGAGGAAGNVADGGGAGGAQNPGNNQNGNNGSAAGGGGSGGETGDNDGAGGAGGGGYAIKTLSKGQGTYVTANVGAGGTGGSGNYTGGSGAAGRVEIDYFDDAVYPASFNFTDLTTQETAEVIESTIHQVTGITSAINVDVHGEGSAEYRICTNGTNDANCDGSVTTNWTATQNTISNNEYIQLRMTSSSSGTTALKSIVDVGYRSIDWSITTGDNNPASFSFNDLTALATSTLTESSIESINGIDVGALVSVSGSGSPQFRICSDSSCTGVVQTWTSTPTKVYNLQYLQLRATTSSSNNTTFNITANTGPDTDNWSISTYDTNPTNFDFTDQLLAPISTLLESDIVQVNGINTAVDVTPGTGTPEYRICSTSNCSSVVQTWTTTVTTIDSGEYLQLRVNTPGTYATALSPTRDITVGTDTVDWAVTTTPDVVPDSLDWVNFNDTSSNLSITGIGTPITLEISAAHGTGTPVSQYRVNSGTWYSISATNVSSVIINNNDTLQFQVLSATTSDTATITINNASDGGTTLDTTVGTVTSATSSCTTGSVTYDTPGTYYYVVMPACTSVTAKGWGGGGGKGDSGGSNSDRAADGGGAGYATKAITVSQSTELEVIVASGGEGGGCGRQGGTGAFAGGNGGGSENNGSDGGGSASGGNGGNGVDKGGNGGDGNYGGGGGAGGDDQPGGGGGGASQVAIVAGATQIIAGGGGGSGGEEDNTSGAGGPGCAQNGSNATGDDSGGGGGGGACLGDTTQNGSGGTEANTAESGGQGAGGTGTGCSNFDGNDGRVILSW